MAGRLLKTAVGAAARHCMRAGDCCASIIVLAMFQPHWSQDQELNSVTGDFASNLLGRGALCAGHDAGAQLPCHIVIPPPW